MKSQSNRKLRFKRKELPKIEVYGEDYIGFTTFDPISNKIIWAIRYDDPVFYGNLDKLNHEYLHWILDNFVSVEASVKLDNVMSFGRFNFE